MKINKNLWEIDKNRKKFLRQSKHELKNSAKKFKQPKESVQIRIRKDTYKELKMYARNNRKTTTSFATEILLSTFKHDPNSKYIFDFL